MFKYNVHFHISLSDEIFTTVNTGIADWKALFPSPILGLYELEIK